LNYVKIQPLDNKIVIVADPMIATENTMDIVLDEIKIRGTPKRLVLLNVISSKQGITYLFNSHPDIEIYTCAIDNEIDNKGYIVPGLVMPEINALELPLKSNLIRIPLNYEKSINSFTMRCSYNTRQSLDF
jgi:hypothetical protein